MRTAGGDLAASEAANYSSKGGIFGGQIGYNYQFDNRVVLGFEGEFSVLNKQSARARTLATETKNPAANGALESESHYGLDWLATLRGRLGYSFGRVMVYGTGGLAFVQQSASRTQYRAVEANADPTSTEHYFTEADTSTTMGWTAGGGFELALLNNWSLKGEYSYAGFDDAKASFEKSRAGVRRSYYGVIGYEPEFPDTPDVLVPVYGTVNGSSNSVNSHAASNSIGLHMFKLGLNYRF